MLLFRFLYRSALVAVILAFPLYVPCPPFHRKEMERNFFGNTGEFRSFFKTKVK